MNESVFDASVAIAIILHEQYDSVIWNRVEDAVMSAVNYAEVLTRLSDLDLLNDPRVDAFLGLLGRIEPFTASQARTAADLRSKTRHVGLSLGDRACLALGIELGAEVYSADRLWSRIEVGCVVRLIR